MSSGVILTAWGSCTRAFVHSAPIGMRRELQWNACSCATRQPCGRARSERQTRRSVFVSASRRKVAWHCIPHLAIVSRFYEARTSELTLSEFRLRFFHWTVTDLSLLTSASGVHIRYTQHRPSAKRAHRASFQCPC